MKPVSNKSAWWIPKVDDLISSNRSTGGLLPMTYIITHISPCVREFGPECRQDIGCTYCLGLASYDPVNGNLSAGNHCFKNHEGEPWWKKVETDEANC